MGGLADDSVLRRDSTKGKAVVYLSLSKPCIEGAFC